MPKFFAVATPLHLIMTYKTILLVQRAALHWHSNNYYTVAIFNLTLNFLIILHAGFFVIQYLLFGIPSGDFQRTNCSVDVGLPRQLASDYY